MDINLTIVGQFLTFIALVVFTMKKVWPPILKTLHDREKKIAAGLEAAERSKRELEQAEHRALSIIRDAKQQATQIIEQANLQGAQLVEQAKSQAKEESQRLIEMAQGEIDRDVAQAKETLRTQVVTLAIAGAEKILKRNLDVNAHQDLLNELAAEI